MCRRFGNVILVRRFPRGAAGSYLHSTQIAHKAYYDLMIVVGPPGIPGAWA
jgi:hypothetical protein